MKQFEPYIFQLSDEELYTLKICCSHLNPYNYCNDNEIHEKYNKLLHSYPAVNMVNLRSKLKDIEENDMIIFIEPEIKFLQEGLKELKDMNENEQEEVIDEIISTFETI